MPLYVFECPEHGRVERLRKAGTQISACDHCAYLMPKVYGYAMALGKPEPDLRGMYRRFTEASQEMADKGGNAGALWPAMKQRAQAMVRAGEA